LKRDTSPLGHRNRVIISTFLGTGIRSNELAHLKLEDVSLEGHYLMVREGKWGRQRPVPLGNNLRKYLWRYMNDWRNDLPARGAPYKRSASTRRRIFSGTPSRRCTCAPAETWSACG
jgi:site-specific recombinase XerD